MPFQSKTGTGSAVPTDVQSLARTILNKAGRGIDAAFRTLTIDNLLVRGKSSLYQLVLRTLTVTGNETVAGTLGVTGLSTLGALTTSGALNFNSQSSYNWQGHSSLPFNAVFSGWLTGSYTSAFPIKVACGSTVQAVDASSNVTIAFGSAFPNQLVMVLAANGDPGTSVNLVVTVFPGSGTSLSQFVARVWNVNTNTGLTNGTNVRCNWIAIGN